MAAQQGGMEYEPLPGLDTAEAAPSDAWVRSLRLSAEQRRN